MSGLPNLVKLTAFGLGKMNFNENAPDRRIIPDEDLYPPPLMSRAPSRKVEGYARLLFAVWYLQIDRAIFLINKSIETEGDFIKKIMNLTSGQSKRSRAFKEKLEELETKDLICVEASDYYGHNILSQTVSPNMPSNLTYWDNNVRYDMIFLHILNKMPKWRLDNLISMTDMFDMHIITKSLHDKFHYTLALIDCGAKFIPEECTDETFKSEHSKRFMVYIHSDKSKSISNLVVESDENQPVKSKFIEHIRENKIECPISLEIPTENPAIHAYDGTIYDLNAFNNVVRKKPKLDPLSGEEVPQSQRVLYLPRLRRFHFY
jgi:hypothetical protein